MWIRDVDFPEALIEAHRAEQLVVFVGAGASRDTPSDLPDVRTLRTCCLAGAPISRSSRRQTFIDAEGMGVPEDLERDADRFAGRLLIPPEYERQLAELRTPDQVQKFALRVGVGPSIVVGRMQHERLIPTNRWQHLIPKYRFHDDN